MKALRNIPIHIYYNTHQYAPFHRYVVRIKEANFNVPFVTLDEAVFFRNLILDLNYLPRPDLYHPRHSWALPEKYQDIEIPPLRGVKLPLEQFNTDPSVPGFDIQILGLLKLVRSK